MGRAWARAVWSRYDVYFTLGPDNEVLGTFKTREEAEALADKIIAKQVKKYKTTKPEDLDRRNPR